MKVTNPKLQLAPLRRGFSILRTLSQSSVGLSYGQLQAACDGLADASLSRLLDVLEEEELIEKDGEEATYRLGPAFLQTARAAVQAVPRETILAPILQSLAERSGQTVGYWEGEGATIVLRSKVLMDESSSITGNFTVNARITRHPAGIVYLAFQPEEKQDRLIDIAKEAPAVSLSAFKERLRAVRQQGFFVDLLETGKPLTRVSAAVRYGEKGGYGGALTIHAPGDSYSKKTIKTFAQQACEEARRASRLLRDYYGEVVDV